MIKSVEKGLAATLDGSQGGNTLAVHDFRNNSHLPGTVVRGQESFYKLDFELSICPP
jgi:hypothetical protein